MDDQISTSLHSRDAVLRGLSLEAQHTEQREGGGKLKNIDDDLINQ